MEELAKKALRDWEDEQCFAVSYIEKHGFLEGYMWALKDLQESKKLEWLVDCGK